MRKVSLFVNLSIFVILVLALSAHFVYAQPRHMKLLAVTETEGNLTGSIADLYLEIMQGQNRVFIETFPLTRLDTQISTRFAKDVACELSNNDCSGMNFIYTIKADSAIVGGPSAGAALAVLTAVAILDIQLHEDVAITGTINSGGLIGPVSGIPEKIDAAAKAGIKKVLIAKGTRNYKQLLPNMTSTNVTSANKTVNITITKFTNNTIDLVEYGAKYNITITEITDLNTAVFEFTGRYLYENNKSIAKETAYESVMKDIASSLCERTQKLLQLMPIANSTYIRNAKELVERAERSQERQDSYSRASYCFAANTKLQTQNMLLQNLSKQDISATIKRIQDDVSIIEKEMSQMSIDTLTDIQTSIIVSERLDETIKSIGLTEKMLNSSSSSKNAIEQLAYTVERLQSARAWMEFFGIPGKNLTVDKTATKEACQRKLAEAQERSQYIKIIFPSSVIADEVMKDAQESFQNEKYLMCLHKAAKAKAEADVVLNTMGVSDDFLQEYVRNKLLLVKEAIARSAERGFFPMLSYSYWEYATALQEHDIYSALLFSEYALEMSDFKLYFQEKKETPTPVPAKNIIYTYFNEIILFSLGLLWGAVITLVAVRIVRMHKRK